MIGSGDGLSLRDAIDQSAEKTAAELPKGSRVAIVAFESAHDGISQYIMEELTGALFDRGIEVADRRNLPYIFQELNFQMSGAVSDETAKSVGKFLAADLVITGDLIDLDSLFRYRTSAINVETAVRASVTRADVRADRATRRMIAALSRQQTVVTETRYGVSADRTPQTAGTFIDRGIMFAMRGEYELAVMDFDEAIRLNPDMAAAYILRARAIYASVSRVDSVEKNFSGLTTVVSDRKISGEQARIYDRAIDDINRAIRLDPNDADAYLLRGAMYYNKGDNDRTIADCTEAIRLDPNFARAYVSRGLTYARKGDYDRAIADYTQAIRIDPNNARSYRNRGLAYDIKDDMDKAIADYTQVIRLAPNFAGTYNRRGSAYANKQDYNRAIADYTEAIRLDPNNVGAYNNRAWTYAYDMKTNYNQALADINQALRLAPNDAGFYLDTRGWVYLGMGDYDKAIADFEAVLRINPNEDSSKKGLEQARQARQQRPAPAPVPAPQPAATTPAAAPPQRPVPDNFVRINGGTFTMGSPANDRKRNSDETQHQVTVSSFYMGKYEVTQKEYQEVMGTNPSYFKEDNLPVESVSWYDAVEYCNKRSQKEGLTPAYTVNGTNVTWNRNANGYRLPTEAEWEYACRAGTTTAYNTGRTISKRQANYFGKKTSIVGSFASNAWGLHDMHGNVWEWCWDWYGSYSSAAQTDPMGASSGSYRVGRGGSWVNSAGLVRSAYRDDPDPDYRIYSIGFRLARN